MPAKGRSTGFPLASIRGAVEYSQRGASPHSSSLLAALPTVGFTSCCRRHGKCQRLSIESWRMPSTRHMQVHKAEGLLLLLH